MKYTLLLLISMICSSISLEGFKIVKGTKAGKLMRHGQKIVGFSRYHQVLRLRSTQMISEIIPSGVLAVYKPKGWTSSDVVSKIRL